MPAALTGLAILASGKNAIAPTAFIALVGPSSAPLTSASAMRALPDGIVAALFLAIVAKLSLEIIRELSHAIHTCRTDTSFPFFARLHRPLAAIDRVREARQPLSPPASGSILDHQSRSDEY